MDSGTTLERWALFAEIAGAFAVVMSVAYLALQVSDSNRLLRSQSHYNALELGQRPLEMLVESENLATVMADCDSDPGSVDPVSWTRCRGLYFMPFNSWEYFHYQYADDSIPAQLWRGADTHFKQQVRTDAGFARFGSEGQIAFDEPFRSYADSIYAATDSAVVSDL